MGNIIIFKGTKVVIPNSVYAFPHAAKDSFSHQMPIFSEHAMSYSWPGMASEIQHLAFQCATCSNQKSKAAERTIILTRIINRTIE